MRPNRAIIGDWVAALRSGRYNQDTGFLRTDKGYDAQGVLCDVVDPEAWSELDTTSGVSPHYNFMYKGEPASFAIPYTMLDDLGIQERYCRVLIVWNDRRKLSFPEIAKLIEQDFLL